MAAYEYYDIEEYQKAIVKKAKRQILYKSNMTDSTELTAILNDFFTDAYKIIVNWRKLKEDDEFLSQKWETEIVTFIVDSYRVMGDETLSNVSINGINKTYRISPTAKLKSSIPQVM